MPLNTDNEPGIVVGIGELLWDLLPGGRKLGGAPANFAYHAQMLHMDACIVSCVGADDPGRDLLDRLGKLGLTTDFITASAAHPTGTVSVELTGNGIPNYTIHENVAWDCIPWTPTLPALASSAQAVCFGSLAQRETTSRATLRQFLRAVPSGCVRVFDINLRKSYYDRDILETSLQAADVLKLNDEEIEEVSRLLDLPAAADAAAAALLHRYDLDLIALTRGSRGSVLVTASERVEHTGVPVTVADTVGAGDAFTAALVAGRLLGKELPSISAAANRLGAFVASQSGATPAIPDRVLSELWIA